jgi:hypothetical protein
LFLHDEKKIHLSKYVLPTASLCLTNLGTYFIYVSNLEGVLNCFLVSSAYFGFINAGTNPFVSDIIFKYDFKLNTSIFKFPGNG